MRRLLMPVLGWGMMALVAGAGEPVKVRMHLDWKTNAQFAGLLWASERGLYRDAGLEVEIVADDGSDDGPGVVERVLADGGNVVGSAEGNLLLAAAAKGQPVRVVGTMMQQSPLVLISREGTGILKAEDLRGKKIGLHADGWLPLRLLLERTGLGAEAVVAREIPYSVAPLRTGEVDAMQGYLVDEVIELRTAGEKVNLLHYADFGYVSYAQVEFVPEEFVRRDPATLRKFLAASRQGWREVFAQPEEAARMLAGKYAPEHGAEFHREAILGMRELLTAEDREIGHMSRETWRASAEMFHKAGVVDKLVDTDKLVDWGFVEGRAE